MTSNRYTAATITAIPHNKDNQPDMTAFPKGFETGSVWPEGVKALCAGGTAP